VVVGGDGTMLGIARELARHNLPLVGINQGRLGFITDIPHGQYQDALAPMIAATTRKSTALDAGRRGLARRAAASSKACR
jgi:NAD kinase